ncbi:putative DnaJ domain-containing protein [Medicago truncatula]|uniref:Chaperone DnaJ domain protein n=1 Tax=Medicago truncatula TaxID=3880 RepID=A0A072UZE7_MEDTR|nr:chaperone protein dnaJ 20, chloroplastic [Medicago truncatula]KEH31240.1 chaperone DnaJ domain protein [Medicago truncatula]RHN62732.1 putative DnaJ domain-containing protein [Medicago truncatula]
MNASSLTSNLSISNSKQFHHLSKQLRPSHVHFATISCRATKLVEETKNGSNFYKMLSVNPKSATMEDIKRAYRSMALQYHPDVCHDPSMKEESTKIFVRLNAAYETLSNPMLREQYDSELGLRNNMMNNNNIVNEEIWRSRWQEQVVELKKRSNRRMEQRGRSWGSTSRMRTQSMKDRN